jgi:hypothetical protein
MAVGVGGIANILAYGIMHMEGVGGIRGWQWYAFYRLPTILTWLILRISILEGILTCVIAIEPGLSSLMSPIKQPNRVSLKNGRPTMFCAELKRAVAIMKPLP